MKRPPSPAPRALTPTLRALLLAERALERCRCRTTERTVALAAIRRVLEDRLDETPTPPERG